MNEKHDILNGKKKLKDILPSILNTIIDQSNIEIYHVCPNDKDSINQANQLFDDVFPEEESAAYHLTSIFEDKKYPLSFVCLLEGKVIAALASSFNFKKEEVELHALAVAEQFSNQKIASLLMLVLQAYSLHLNINCIQVISSQAGRPFYLSFGFSEPSYRCSFRAQLPFDKMILSKKLNALEEMHIQAKVIKKRKAETLSPKQLDLLLFSTNKEKKRKIEFPSNLSLS
jgi:predicted N-acetyltransferase YhbS